MAQPATAETPETSHPAATPGGDSIGEQLEARLAQLPAVPGDAMDWASLAALYEREAAALGTEPSAARLLHEAGRIHEERLADPAGALAYYRRAAASDRLFLPNLQAARRLANALGDLELECDLLQAEAAAVKDPRDEAALDLVRARLLEERLGRATEGRAALAAAASADPESLAVAEHQAILAAAEGRDEDLSRALERCAELAAAPGLAAAWLVSASGVEQDRLGQPDRAAHLALRAFELAPADATVRAAARRHSERQLRFDALARVLSAGAAAEGAPPREAGLALCELARIEEERLSHPAQARAVLERARQVGGTDPIVLDALARIHEARGDWQATADVLRARAAAGVPEDPAELVTGNLRLAELCDERLGRPDEALACYRAVLSIDPHHRGALAALGRLYARAGNWEQLLGTFLSERDAAGDARERAQRCFKAAEVLEEHLGRIDQAIELYREALVLDPSLLAASQALERLYERTGLYAELAALLEADLAATHQPEERIALLFRLARLHEDRLGDLDAAARDYDRILELAPEHAVALRALASVHEHAGRHAELVQLLERLGRQTTDPRKAIALLQRTAEVQEEQLGDEAAAATACERILRLDPTYLPALRALGRLYARTGRWAELVAMCRAEAEASPSTESAAGVLFRVGEILEQRMGQELEAVAAYHEVLTLSPAHVGALRALARLYRARSEWESLIEVLRAEAATRATPDRQAALLCEVAEIWETRLGEPDRAVEVQEEILRIIPGFEASLRALDRMLAEQGRWAELAALRRDQAEHAHGPARVNSLVRAAELLANRLGDGAAAEQACRAARAEAPDDLAALLLLARFRAGRAEARADLAARVPEARGAAQLLVAAALDRAAAGEDGAPYLARAVELAPDQPVAAPLVEGMLRRAGDAVALASHLAARRDAERDQTSKAHWALRVGEAWETAGDPERALAAYRESLALAPDALPALRAVRRAYARAGAWSEVRATLQVEGASLRDAGLAAAAFAEAGEVAISRLGDPAAAAADWRSALERDPFDSSLTDRLAVLLQSSGSPAEACELREAQARAEVVPERAAEIWIAAARLAVQVGDGDRALADLELALAVHPACAQALLVRGEMLAEAGRPVDAARDLSACLALGGDSAMMVRAHLDLAVIHQGSLGDPQRAMSHLNAILATDPENSKALARLARAHRDAHNWPAAADALRRIIALPSLAPEQLRDHLVELADVRAEGFGDVASAAELCERALQLAPGDTGVQARLERLKKRAADHPGVSSVVEAAAAAAPAGSERARVHLRAARVLSSVLGDARQAVAELRRAVEADPGHGEARAALADLYASIDPALAVEEHRRFLAEDPARHESWRALHEIFRVARAHDRAFVAAGVLRFLQASDTAADGAYFAQIAPQAPSGTSQALAPSEWLALRHPAARGPLSDLLSLVGDALAEAAGLSAGPRDKLKGAQPLWHLVEELCANVGTEPFALRNGGEGTGLLIEPGNPPAVRAGADVARRHSVPEQRFLLARAAARLRARSGLTTRLDPSALGELLAAAVRQVVPSYDGTGQPSDALVKAVGRALPRRVRKALDEPARAVALAGSQDVAAWQVGLAATADRVGLLFAGDVPSALGILLREGGLLTASAAEVTSSVRARADLRQLLLFTISEEHFRLRQRLRLAIA
jgi:tetratricopeptide (TPR) repeat protein